MYRLIFALFLVFTLILCSDPNAKNMSDKNLKVSNADLCTSVIESIINRSFKKWDGLEADCDWSLLGLEDKEWDTYPLRFLGSEFRKTNSVLLPLEGYYRPSLSFEDGEAVLFEGMSPELDIEDEQLRELFGDAEAILDWNHGTMPMSQGECVYASKGITLFMNTAQTGVFHIALYPKTTVDNYLLNLRPNFKKKRK